VPDVARGLVADLGARAIEVSPEAHDHALARTSHLPYLVALALADTGRESAERSLSGPGYRDMTRLAASDPRMAGAYVRANAAEVRDAWAELREAIERRVREATD
jgi:prephenate dehydrogenase